MSAEQKPRGTSDEDPTPPCEATDEANYTAETVTGGLLAFHEPCGYPDCYPGDECPGMGEEVLRARGSAGNKLHRMPSHDGGEN